MCESCFDPTSASLRRHPQLGHLASVQDHTSVQGHTSVAMPRIRASSIQSHAPIGRRLVLGGGLAVVASALFPRRTAAALGRQETPSEGIEVDPGLVIRPRSAWAGEQRPPSGPLTAETDVRFLLVHHSASSNDYTEADVASTIQGFHAFHTGPDKGWPDIAYNFMIDRFGTVWEARTGSLDGPVIGDATGGNQGFSQLVCLIGDFTSEPPPKVALDSLVRTLAWLADRSSLDTSPGATTRFVSRGSNRHAAGVEVTTPTINGHRSMSNTTCPGDALFPYVASGLMADVTSLRAPVTTTEPTTTEPTADKTTTTESTAPSSTGADQTGTSSPDSEAAASLGDDASDGGGLSLGSYAAIAAGGVALGAAGTWYRRSTAVGPDHDPSADTPEDDR